MLSLKENDMTTQIVEGGWACYDNNSSLGEQPHANSGKIFNIEKIFRVLFYIKIHIPRNIGPAVRPYVSPSVNTIVLEHCYTRHDSDLFDFWPIIT